MGFTLQQHSGVSLSEVVKNCSAEGLQLLEDMLKWDPSKRPSAQQILSYSFFNSNKVLPSVNLGRKNTNDYYRQSRNNFNNRRNVFELEGKNILNEQRYAQNHQETQQQSQQQKFGDSSTNFLDFLDKQVIEKDHQRQKDKKQSKLVQVYGTNNNNNKLNNNHNHNQNVNKFGDSTSNFLDLIDQKLQENEKHNDKQQSRNRGQRKYPRDDKLDDLDKDLFDDDKFNYKKPNPFKLTKQKDYNDNKYL